MRRLRLWPTGLTAQIAACIVLALFLSQALTALLAIFLEPRHQPPPSPMAMADRVASIIEVLDAVPASDRARIAASLSHGDIHVRIEKALAFAPSLDTPPATLFRNALADQLGERFPLQANATQTRARTERLEVRARLDDGAIIAIDTTMPGPPNLVAFEIGHFLFYLPFLTVAIAVLTLWATRRVTAPLRAFSDAAESLGSERSAPPLPERGPAELQRAARSFNKMQEQVKRFIEDRTRMLAAIGHDLRTPITRLRLRVETAVESAEEQRKMLQDIDRMDAMVSSALSFLRDSARDEPTMMVDLASLLQSACDDFSEIGHDVRYVGAANLSLRCRPEMLGRAVTNLIENATKYAGAATVGLDVESDGNAVIAVEDDGPGIADGEKEKAFDPFYRLDPARGAETGGFGLGLSIARTIVELHGGRIGLEDRSPTGLRVLVTLPSRTRHAG